MAGDIRYAWRTFASRPSFAVAAIATLALGIAVNTITFSLLNSLALRPMPVPDAERVVRVHPVDASARRRSLFSYADYLDYRGVSPVFEALAAYIPADLTAGRSSLDRSISTPRATLGYVASASYFDLTGVRPALGRVLQPQDEAAMGRAAVLSHAFWQTRFGGDAGIIGATLTLNGEPFTVVGVAAPGFAGTEPLVADVWIPLSGLSIAVPGTPPLSNRDAEALLIVGRLSPGVSRAGAAETLRVEAARLAAAYPGAARPASVTVTPGTFFTLDPGAKPVIAGVMAVVGLVLLIACANVANLILARAASRQREIAVRLAIGATRERIIQQLTVEALMSSLAAGASALLALGKALAAGVWASPRTVIGVVRDASNAAIWRDKEMAVYLPVQASTDPRDLRLIARTQRDLAAAARALRTSAASLDPDLRFEAAPLDHLLRMWMLPSRVAAGAASALAAMALAIACIGVCGVVSFTVSRRMREIGVRMALGADARSVARLVLNDAWRLVWKGLALGAVYSLITAPLLGRLLFDVSAFDPVTMAGRARAARSRCVRRLLRACPTRVTPRASVSLARGLIPADESHAQ